MSRRDLLKAGAAAAIAGQLEPAFPDTGEEGSGGPGPSWMNMAVDGLGLTPSEHTVRIQRLAGRKGFEADEYSIGGAVAELETAFASLLGKETAVFMPTGTLANHLAVRALAGERHGAGFRVLLPATSHIYNDTGDALTALSGMNMVPLGLGTATFTLAEVEAQLARAAGGRVATRAGVLVVESPVRRRDGELFDPEELRRVTSFARGSGIRLHLDGARMLIASAYTGVTPATMAAPFDTVYVSLYKGLNAPSGAILAGPRNLLDGLFHARRMFGGGLPEAWPFAAGALEDLPGFVERLKVAVASSEQVFQALETRGIPVRRVPRGTNVAFLPLGSADPVGVQKFLADARVRVRTPSRGGKELRVTVNESWSRRDPGDLAQVLARALGRG
jgi:threonine aldolase